MMYYTVLNRKVFQNTTKITDFSGQTLKIDHMTMIFSQKFLHNLFIMSVEFKIKILEIDFFMGKNEQNIGKIIFPQKVAQRNLCHIQKGLVVHQCYVSKKSRRTKVQWVIPPPHKCIHH